MWFNVGAADHVLQVKHSQIIIGIIVSLLYVKYSVL